MTTLLLCSVGSRDVQISAELLPAHLRDWRTAPERERATYLLEHFDALAEHIELAIMRKALRYLGHTAIDHIVLLASDQDDPAFRATDTIITAEVAARLLQTRWSFASAQVHIQPLRTPRAAANPSDHDEVLSCLELLLPELDARYQPDKVYLEVTGGTPAMANGLLLGGMEVFQQRANALYISRHSEMPHTLAVGQRLLSRPLRDVFLSNVRTFQYEAALTTWALFRPYFTDDASAAEAEFIETLLQHAAARLNLDLPAALAVLQGKDQLRGGRYRSLIEPLYNALAADAREQKLAEVLFVAQVRLQTGNYAEFLSQVVRCIENTLRLLCLRHGVPFVDHKRQQRDDNGPYVDQGWLDQRRLGRVKMGQQGLQELLGKIAADDPAVQSTLTAAKRLQPLIWLRNDLTHSFAGVSKELLSTTFGDAYTAILPLLEQLYAQVVGSPLAANPYHSINAVLHDQLS